MVRTAAQTPPSRFLASFAVKESYREGREEREGRVMQVL